MGDYRVLLVSRYGAMITGFGSTHYVTSGSEYDGSNDYATRGAELTGLVDGKTGIVSFWQLNGSTGLILTNGTSEGTSGLTINASQIRGRNSAGTSILNISANPTPSDGVWRHILVSWDLTNTSKRHLYVNDSSALSVATYTDDTIDYTKANWSVAAGTSGAAKNAVQLSELFFHTSYLDLSILANRRKFIGGDGRPVNLGADGSTPLTVQPLLYVPNGDPSTNAGSGGNFTITGELSAAETSPSD